MIFINLIKKLMKITACNPAEISERFNSLFGDALPDNKKDCLNAISKNSAAILNLYQDKGYLAASVDADVAINKERQEARIDFKISEGGKSRVKKVTIVGNKYLEEAELKKYMAVQEDGLFSIFSDGGYLQYWGRGFLL